MTREYGEVDGKSQGPGEAVSRPSLLVFFRCANLYRRVYREANGREYLARCPKCGRSTRFIVGEGGTGQRAFEVQCG